MSSIASMYTGLSMSSFNTMNTGSWLLGFMGTPQGGVGLIPLEGRVYARPTHAAL